MWLINTASITTRQAIASYFRKPSIFQEGSGQPLLLGGEGILNDALRPLKTKDPRKITKVMEDEMTFGEMDKNLDKLYEKIDPHIFRITSEEALDLPPKVYVTRQFHLSDQQKKLMKELKEQFFIQAQNKDFSSVSNAAGLLTKLQQISCGYLPMDDKSFMELPNPRLDELLSILDQREGKAIIWCRFNRDIEKVMEKLQPFAVHYYGKTTQAERERHKAAFLDANSTVRYLVASPEAAGTGLNLQGLCNTNIYYSNSFNSLARWQSEGRTWRDGTVGTVTYFDLIANKSPDAKILKNLQDKKSISDLTLDEYRKIFDFLLENE
jgi:SNF2 family DNA or RNA helicase